MSYDYISCLHFESPIVMFIVFDTRGGALRNLGPRVSIPSLLWIAAAEATSPREENWGNGKEGEMRKRKEAEMDKIWKRAIRWK